jgi:hypothetical protein
VSRWQDEITCAVLTGVSNARSESLNRIAELEARMAYSFRNPATPQPPRPHRMQPRPAITDNNYKTTTPRDRPEARPRSTSKSPIVLLRFVAARPAAAYGSHRGLLLDELIAGVGLCLLLVGWSALRVWRLSPGRQARQALANGVWSRGTYEYKLRHDGVAWRAPDRSAVFLPWSALAGTCETERLFLLMDAEGRTVRGFIPKTGRSDLPSDAELGRLIRERIQATIS